MLADLDELILTCADPRSRAYIKESVQCYKAGAYRASVVACWIAVAFDLVDKIRELAAGGDKQAQEQVARFEQIQARNDISGALGFEKELPSMALSKFEFISSSEYLDLSRLIEDRNRCAHPSQVTDDQVFQASAELARLHISNSIKAILSQPATQGKSALDRIMLEVDSRYFPSKKEDVYDFFNAGPLGRPKKSLYKNFITIMVKGLMHAGTPGLRRSRASNSLIAMQTMHPELWAVHFPDVLRAVMGSILSEADLAVAARFFVYPKGLGAWELLSKVEKLRVCNFVRNAPVPMLEDLDDFFDLPNTHELYKSALARIQAASFDELKAVAWTLFVPDEVFKEILKFYERSESFAVANEIGKYIRGQLGDVLGLKGFLDSIIRIAAKNDQVKFSNELVNLLRAFASDKSIGLDYVRSEISNYKLTVEGL